MPLGPKQLEELTEEEKAVVKEVERKIDEYLSSHYAPGLTFYSVPISPISPKVFRQIVSDYMEAGWPKVARVARRNVDVQYVTLSVD